MSFDMPDKKPSTLYVDEDGDLRLELGPERQSLVVDSRALSRSSPVFKKMLYGEFAESKHAHSDREWAVQLPEDNAAAFAIPLNIMHGRFHEVPDTLEAEDLFEVTIITDKYDMTQILRPWAKKWCEPLHDQIGQPGHEILLWIAWELGSKDIFEKMAQYLVCHSTVDADGALMSTTNVPLETYDYLMPLGILGMNECHSNFCLLSPFLLGM
jgi:hypothetical protein